VFDIQIQFFENPPLPTRKILAVVDKGGIKDIMRKFMPFAMGMQVSCGVHAEMLEEGAVWHDRKVSGSFLPSSQGSAALCSSFVNATYREVRLIPHDFARLASECF
jgi:hypothetical protein